MLAAMNALRLSAAVTAVAVILAVAGGLGACGPGELISICTIPTQGEVGADGGPDPCHCDPPASLNITNCGCLTGTQQDLDVFNACMATLREEQDAGEEGPIPGCTGHCWPGSPLGWSSPLLLWVGQGSAAPPCPDVAPIVLYDGQNNGVFAVACTSTASGSCSGLADVCGPGQADGFWPCVSVEGDHACVSLSPYTEPHVFDEDTFGPTTFCCLPAPLSP
jgi:hypothetical protein